jgi:hypothetical protein
MSDAAVTEDDPGTVAAEPVHDAGLRQTNESKLLPIVLKTMEERDLYFDSLLDVGFGTRPLDQWFARQRRTEAPRRYVGIDQDSKAVETAVSRGTLAFVGFNAPFDLTSDLVIAADVLEHVAPSSATSLLKKCASLTTKMFALSTLNARQWTRTGMKRDYTRLKFMPDSVVQCYRPDDDPSRIRNVIDSERVASLMHETFDDREWDVEVYEAWPWEIRDLSGDAEFRCYLKTFAVAVAKEDRGGAA